MANSKALRAFLYGVDGINALQVNVGDVLDFGDATAGLTEERFIEPVSLPPVVASPGFVNANGNNGGRKYRANNSRHG